MDFDLVEKQIVYAGKIIRLERHRLDTPHGIRFREICVHPGACVILPMITADTVLLIRNYRYAVGQELLELPAGTLEANETPMNSAGRELLEETGYVAGRMTPLGSFYASPGVMTEKMHCFVATELTHQGQQLQEGEEIELAPTGYDRALDMIAVGDIVDGKTIAALLMYDRFHRGKK
ncbi:MAG TPA: NUDIX hydrolase [Tepidisphaeraceae bacterium]|jgi:ADP-ribose pyrophosphatase